jgi:hypothetical protein
MPAPIPRPSKPERTPLRAAWSYIYIEIWLRRYRFKVGFGTVITGLLILIFSAIEILGPILHLLPEHGAGRFGRFVDFIHGVRGRYELFALLLLVAGSMVIHHEVLGKRIGRFRALFGYVMAAESIRQSAPAAPKASATALLDALVRVVSPKASKAGALITPEEKLKRERAEINSSILIRDSGAGQDFSMYTQNSNGRFDATKPVPATASAAGKLVAWQVEKQRPGALLYVPRTNQYHGAGLWSDADAEGPLFNNCKWVDFAFNDLGHGSETFLASLACVQIPMPATEHEVILCMGSGEPNRFDELEFIAAKMTATMLAEIVGPSLTAYLANQARIRSAAPPPPAGGASVSGGVSRAPESTSASDATKGGAG